MRSLLGGAATSGGGRLEMFVLIMCPLLGGAGTSGGGRLEMFVWNLGFIFSFPL